MVEKCATTPEFVITPFTAPAFNQSTTSVLALYVRVSVCIRVEKTAFLNIFICLSKLND